MVWLEASPLFAQGGASPFYIPDLATIFYLSGFSEGVGGPHLQVLVAVPGAGQKILPKRPRPKFFEISP
jgi:hypothetical protein